VEEASGGGEWRRRVEETSGGGEWGRRVEEASGGGEWRRREGGGGLILHLQFPLELPWQWHHVLLEATHDLRLVLLNACHCGIWCGRYIKERQLCSLSSPAAATKAALLYIVDISRSVSYVRGKQGWGGKDHHRCEYIWRRVLCVSAISCMQ
jgi:hypothetical protein